MTISQVNGVRADIAEMLDKIKDVTNRSKAFKQNNVISEADAASFTNVFDAAKSALSNVNEMQTKSEALKDAYISGSPEVSLSQVVVSAEKSKLAFEGLIIVRNKCLEAYKEIMNMPV